MIQRLKQRITSALPRTVSYAGRRGGAWFAEPHARTPSIAAIVCGDDAARTAGRRILRSRIESQALDQAARGRVAMTREHTNGCAIRAPMIVHQHVDLPATIEELHAKVRTSTTREDLRRIRKAAFSFRVTTDPQTVREFYDAFYVPLLNQRFPDDAVVSSPDTLIEWLGRGGELICAEQNGEWLAGFFNVCHDDRYALNWMGVRDGDASIRRSHIIAALYVRSMERGVELGRPRATFGRALPFLGKGPAWFKAKWGGVIAADPDQAGSMFMFADMRHAAIRRMLADSPVVFDHEGLLAAALWIEGGENDPAKRVRREVDHFAGIERWFVFGPAESIDRLGEAIARDPRIATIEVRAAHPEPCWLGELAKAA